jgi:hydrogenase maturation factor
VKIYSETQAICRALKLDPWGLIASGALLITSHPEGSDIILRALSDSEIPAGTIGNITEASGGLTRTVNGTIEPMPVFERDEIARLYSDQNR